MDRHEANDLAEQNPKKLAELKALWQKAAEENNVFPLDDRGAARLSSPKPPVPGSDSKATKFAFYEGVTRLGETAAPNMKNRSWSVEASLKVGDTVSEGVIFAIGGVSA